MIEKHTATVGQNQDGERLDIAIVELIPALSRKKAKSIIDAGGVYLNKKRILFAKQVVRRGDKIEIFFEKIRDENFEQKSTLSRLKKEDILFENENFLAVNKPAGVPSQATLTSASGTILHELEKLNQKKYPQKSLSLVHRLDKDTSGVLLIALNPVWRKFLEDAFRDHRIQKTYEALTFYHPKEMKGEITYPIAKSMQQKNTYYAVLKSGGKHTDKKSAHTDYSVIEIFHQKNACHVRCFPKSGRTHQIRVHLMAIGCPILGDKTYAQNVVGHELLQFAHRQMLHAESISFRGPNGEVFDIKAPHPADFLNCLTVLKSDEKNT